MCATCGTTDCAHLVRVLSEPIGTAKCWWDAPHDAHRVGYHSGWACPGKTAAEIEKGIDDA